MDLSITGPGQDSSKVGIMVSNVDNVSSKWTWYHLATSKQEYLFTGSNGFKLDSTILENNQIAVSMTGADNAE